MIHLLNNGLSFSHFLQLTIMSNNHIFADKRIRTLDLSSELIKLSRMSDLLLYLCGEERCDELY